MHSPPVNRLTPQQLKDLSMECQKYPLHNSMRGRYDASYCEDAIAAWGDEPLQIVTIDQGSSDAPSGSSHPLPADRTIP